ncbi:MAG: cysteine--tRNA ligase [Candidatus Pacebacteria bacterium]|nr:cysteine--tRNA ligase [Candidatus Paceibacterota bacterium]
MKLFNSLTRQIETVEPINPPNIGFYACGITAYDYTHIGHLRKYTMDDVLVRALRQEGFSVNHVQNVTDVGHLASEADTGEDKLEKGAKKYNLDVWELARKFEDYFFYSMDQVNIKRPDVSCRATDHIAQMLKLVKTLEEKGFTYLIEGDGVYFDTAKLDDYGELSPVDLEELQAGARVELVTGKRNPTDFALWKFERPGESRAMKWESPWAEASFPGWHLECSAMSMEYLGEQFDIHTGGIDHLSIHHPNEIAQSEAATGKKPFVRYWVHHNHLMVEGEKMSKSKGNFLTVDDLKERGFEPLALRLLFLQSHYRNQQNFTWDSLAAAQNSWEKLVFKVDRLKAKTRLDPQLAGFKPVEQLSDQAQKLSQRFFDWIRQDLKTPEALAVLWQVVNGQLPAEEKITLLDSFDQVLGLNLLQAQLSEALLTEKDLPQEVEQLLAERELARQEENWDRADQIRDDLRQAGFEVVDGQDGQQVRGVK